MSRRDDDLAYGDYHGQEGEEGDRGLLGDMGRRFGFGRKEVSYVSLKRHVVMVHLRCIKLLEA